MKNLFFVLVAVATLTVMSGCCCQRGHGHGLFGCGLFRGSCGQCSDCPDTCQSCDSCADPGCRGGCRGAAAQAADAGPATGAVTYPYYTNRGPRDFLARNPRSIGP